MKAIGRITHCDVSGNLSVQMFYDGKWQGEWRLRNRGSIPVGHPQFALFQFEEASQLCDWIDPNK